MQHLILKTGQPLISLLLASSQIAINNVAKLPIFNNV
jgi:hypothetical protein